ncbi:hypothetical protein C8R45DRAFT_1207787 [Mycena sanguinolenta]|nr:hypothetical protein C8R45DRAFT_1207787 [Mycena sanguinolenta]
MRYKTSACPNASCNEDFCNSVCTEAATAVAPPDNVLALELILKFHIPAKEHQRATRKHTSTVYTVLVRRSWRGRAGEDLQVEEVRQGGNGSVFAPCLVSNTTRSLSSSPSHPRKGKRRAQFDLIVVQRLSAVVPRTYPRHRHVVRDHADNDEAANVVEAPVKEGATRTRVLVLGLVWFSCSSYSCPFGAHARARLMLVLALLLVTPAHSPDSSSSSLRSTAACRFGVTGNGVCERRAIPRMTQPKRGLQSKQRKGKKGRRAATAGG